jgi:hypothetical protein
MNNSLIRALLWELVLVGKLCLKLKLKIHQKVGFAMLIWIIISVAPWSMIFSFHLQTCPNDFGFFSLSNSFNLLNVTPT